MIRDPAELDIDEAGRVEIPLEILAEAGISPGTRLLVFSDGEGRIVLRRVDDAINDLLREGTL
ncbi:AbrB/MazE/SpoVT family DNA-binding domain-containing protein [Streptomyces sp. SID11233]|uniref:AbrB/MazE/SpoVT family DNA-binding domain-containing protein n=1 Tax=Streptomyces sp. SID11385 TaxID=2706031 RepID=UPI0013BEFB16|nr:AbrB/MazE/SpoVT family DNA-binding domain-containing protein [Streptomyces sp. SID11385]NED79922.1 AbrB/MazE/SpoVT family DNA-binding domain-containing protein [Streptomyces sp. SID11233]